MAKARLTRKGQITVPKEVRDRLGLRPGDELEFTQDETGYRVQKLIPVSPFAQWRGYLKALAGRTTDELMDELRAVDSTQPTFRA